MKFIFKTFYIYEGEISDVHIIINITSDIMPYRVVTGSLSYGWWHVLESSSGTPSHILVLLVRTLP